MQNWAQVKPLNIIAQNKYGAFMLSFDKNYALLIAIIFGLAGLPWAFWLFRKDERAGIFEKIIIGYTLGIILVPLMFLLESLVGILYSPILIYVNWAIIFLSGMYFALKDKSFGFEFNFTQMFSQQTISKIALFAIMFAVLFIGLSASIIPIMDLDPYFYIDGVRQVVYEGSNYANDMTAWYPLPISSHMGQPIWKYMLASWFSIYNGQMEYSPYTLIAVSSIYPPIIGALSAFFAYFIFKYLYNERTGLLGAGILAFMPIMITKFQGGDFQIEPYNIFAFVFLFGSIVYALKKHSKESYALMFVALIAAFLASNLSLLLLAVLSASIFAIGIAYFLQPCEEGANREKTLSYFIAGIVVVQIISMMYNIASGSEVFGALKGALTMVIIPFGAFASTWVLNRIFSEKKNELTPIRRYLGIEKLKLDIWSKIAVLTVIAILAISGFFISQGLPLIGDTIKSYTLFGAYTEPLYRTIAEQAPGSEYYGGQIGAIGIEFAKIETESNDILGMFYSLGSSIMNAMNTIPNAIVNFVYGLFIAIMNSVSEVDTFEKVEKGNSMMTAIVFWAITMLGISALYEVYKKRIIGIDTLLILPFTIPVVLMAFGKAKLVMYLALAMVFLTVALWASLERIVKYVLKRYAETKLNEADAQKESYIQQQKIYKRILKALSICVILILVLIQFGPAYALTLTIPGQEITGGLYSTIVNSVGYGAMPLFVHSFEPRIYDNEQKVLPKLERYCALSADSTVCTRVQNWNDTINDPVKYYEQSLCARSLWPYTDKTPSIGMQVAIGYRCSFVSDYWLDSMQWIDENVPQDQPGSRVTSWWDYGHWINFFGQTDTVLRNEHGSTEMIGRTATALLHQDVEFLRNTMKEYDSKYLLVDIEILGAGYDKYNMELGGKYSALNYLGCAWMNQTTVEKWPGQSECENNHLWETVYVPQQQDTGGQPCTISTTRGLGGIIGYRMYRQADGNSNPQAQYCFTQEYENGEAVIRAYNLDKKDENGDLIVVDATWIGYSDEGGIVLTAYYDDPTQSDSAFYESNIYSAFFLDELEGFDLVYSTPQIRIFKMKDEYWN